MENLTSFFQILDVSLVLESDSSEFMELFERDYGMFRKSKANIPIVLNVEVRLNDKDAAIVINNKRISFAGGHPNPNSYARHIILRELFKEIKDFIILHAGVVVKDNRALILSGPPGVGKTTLVISLVEKDYDFFSDDYCPVHKETGKIYPFPRSLWKEVRSDVSKSAKENMYGSRTNKEPIMANQIESQIVEEPCRAYCLICLDPGPATQHIWEIEIGFEKGKEREFLNDVEDLRKKSAESVRSASKQELFSVDRLNGEFSEWRIRYPKGYGVTKDIRKIIDRRRGQILNVYRMDTVRPDFDRDPVITPVSLHDAAFFLLGELKQGFPFELDKNSSTAAPGAFFAQLMKMLDQVSCYRLSIGRLEEMLKLVEKTMS